MRLSVGSSETARIGRMGNFEVIIYTDDIGFTPHVHVVDSATKGLEFDSCIQLDGNKYFIHGKRCDTLDNYICKVL